MTESTTTTAALHPGVAVQYAIHGALRRDMDRLVGALSTYDVPDDAVGAYAAEFLFQLHHHHTFEDDAVWPLMGERLGESVTSLLDRNRAEHTDVVASVDAFTTSVTPLGTDRASALAAATRMRDVVSTHLAHEEADVIPLAPDAFTMEDVARFQAESAKENPPDRFLPWVLESAAEPIAAGFHGTLPPQVQELLATAWMPAWQAKVTPLVAAAG
jgi:hemerythrin-like domain-containing protein